MRTIVERAATGVGFEAFQSIEYEPGFEKVAIFSQAGNPIALLLARILRGTHHLLTSR